MQCESRLWANAVERAHTNSLDVDDKLIQTRPHVRNTIASRKRQVVMRKGKSTNWCVKILGLFQYTSKDFVCCVPVPGLRLATVDLL